MGKSRYKPWTLSTLSFKIFTMKTIAGDETDATPLCVGTAGLRGGLLLEKMKPGLLSW
jgi:hypothetical protein